MAATVVERPELVIAVHVQTLVSTAHVQTLVSTAHVQTLISTAHVKTPLGTAHVQTLVSTAHMYYNILFLTSTSKPLLRICNTLARKDGWQNFANMSTVMMTTSELRVFC